MTEQDTSPTSTGRTEVSIEEFRNRLADLMGRVVYGREAVVITKYRRQAAVLISAAEYERLLDPTRRLTRRQWQTQVRKLDAARRQVNDIDPEELESLVEKAVAEVRARKASKRPHASQA
jgi:prevent-host-death family protein